MNQRGTNASGRASRSMHRPTDRQAEGAIRSGSPLELSPAAGRTANYFCGIVDVNAPSVVVFPFT
jgi:hypothetical protein